jgi:hypothetical protein
MLIKWLAAFFTHGLASVGALLAAVLAVWWVEPTTNGGIAFLMIIAFILALAVIEIARKLVAAFRPSPQPAAQAPAAASVDAPPARPADEPGPLNR